jgi:hypothetical protein
VRLRGGLDVGIPVLDPDTRYFLVSFDQAERRREAERRRLVSRTPHRSWWQPVLVGVRASFAAFQLGHALADLTSRERSSVEEQGRHVVERRIAQGGVLRFVFGDDPELSNVIDTAGDLADQTGHVGQLVSVLHAYFGQKDVAARIESQGVGSALCVTAQLG